ncbi:MAG: hypothetical protein H6809_07235 [Phycisphaeraceae bacterium]|nr:hypothetical protein [Phycisphaeraceae bacterium]
MAVTGYRSATGDLGRRSMMAMKEGPGSGAMTGLPPEAFAALSERVRLVEDRQQTSPTKAELTRAITRAAIIGSIAGAVGGCLLAVLVTSLIA